MRHTPWLWLAIGCAPDPPKDSEAALVPTATCERTDNRLRFRCSAALPTAATAVWTIRGDDGTVRRFTTPEGPDSEVTVWGLPPRTDFSFEVEAGGSTATGSFATKGLPPELSPLEITATGTASVDAVGLVQTCGTKAFLLIVDGAGRVVWYEQTDAPPRGGGGYDFTSVGTVVRSSDAVISEIAMDGTVLWRTEGFERTLHHDVRRGGDHVYALNAGEHDGYVLDGVYVLTDGELVASWDLADHVTPSPGLYGGFWNSVFPGATDWSHGNSVWSDGQTLLLSLRWQDAVIAVAADPDAPDFGTIDWVLTGSTESGLPSDFTWPGGGGFDGQHHATPTDGGLMVFDNGAIGTSSRALAIGLDPAAGTATEAAAWPIERHCNIQGAAFPLPGGGVLATCAVDGRMIEFVPGELAPRFDLTVTCPFDEDGLSGLGGSMVARGYPVDLP